jgi:acyl carrier protein
MDRGEMLNQLRKILVDDLFVAVPAEEIEASHELGPRLGLDSIGFVELAVIVGNRFQIQAAEADVAQGHFATLEKLCSFIEERMAARERKAG